MRSLALTATALALVLAACNDAGPAGMSRVEFAVSTQAAPGATPFTSAETFMDSSGNALEIDSVAVVVRKLKLEGSTAACIGDDGEEEHDSLGDDHDSLETVGDSGDSGDHDCAVLKLGPFLVDLPIGTGGAERQFTVTVDTGTYREVKFQSILPDSIGDGAFLAAHPGFGGVSIRVVGQWNGAPFTYTTGVTDVQEVEFMPPLVVGESPTTFTLFVDLAGWFRSPTGALVDPATAQGAGVNSALVRENILRSFHAFEDEDHDGHDDHDEGGSD